MALLPWAAPETGRLLSGETSMNALMWAIAIAALLIIASVVILVWSL
jgi:hypothetical protein